MSGFIEMSTHSVDSTKGLVTVITVTFNSSAFISDAIESVLASSYTNLELIIGDDCSSDDTWEKICKYNDKRIISYRNLKNIGEYPNRNKALSMAKGEYLIFIDGDDMIYPHGLEFMVKMLHAFPSCAMALMRWFRNDLFYPVVITSEQFYVGEYFGNGFLGTAFSNVLFRTKILHEVGGLPNTCKTGDDYIRYTIAARHNSLLINDGLTWWRETPGQASEQSMKSILGTIQAYQLKFDFLKDQFCPLSKSDKILARMNLNISFTKLLLRKLFKFKLRDFFRLAGMLKYPEKKLIFFKKLEKRNPFPSYSSVHPYRHALNENPYAREFNNT